MLTDAACCMQAAFFLPGENGGVKKPGKSIVCFGSRTALKGE